MFIYLFRLAKFPCPVSFITLTLRYTTWLNRRHNRIGHLFHGRYKALLVDATDWVLSCFGSKVGSARKRYMAFVNDAVTSEMRKEYGQGTHGGRILGDDEVPREVP
nr:hypothetical protein [Pelotalea chapellei]